MELNKKYKKKNFNGVTLIEVIVSLFIVSITFIFILSIFPAGARQLKKDENLLTASFVAQNILEQQRHKEFDKINSLTDKVTYMAIKNGVSYSRQFSYNLNVTTENSKLKLLTITVAWKERKQNRTLCVQSKVYKR